MSLWWFLPAALFFGVVVAALAGLIHAAWKP